MDDDLSGPEAIGLGTGLRALLHALDDPLQSVYDRHDIRFRPRFFAVVRRLQQVGSANVEALRLAARVSQPAMTQTLTMMEREGLVERREGADRRERMVALTPGGRDYAESIEPIFAATRRAAAQLERDAGVDFTAALRVMLSALAAMPFDERVEAALRSDQGKLG